MLTAETDKVGGGYNSIHSDETGVRKEAFARVNETATSSKDEDDVGR
jgi:hypothetical protein